MTNEQKELLCQTSVDEEFVSIHSSIGIGNNKEKVWVTTKHKFTKQMVTVLWERNRDNFSKYAFYYVSQTRKMLETI